MTTPLLTGSSHELALEAVEAIALQAEPAIERWAEAHPTPAGEHAHSLAWGRSGVALFYAYREHSGFGGGDTAVELLDRAIDALADSSPDPSLFTGFPGVAWTGEHFRNMARAAGVIPDDADDDDPNAEIDTILEQQLTEAEGTPVEWDLVGGLAGLGVYACERLPRPGGRALLGLIVDAIAAQATPETHGVAWRTPAGRRRLARAAASPEWDLGVAHGIPGVIALLGLALEADVRADTCRRLIAPAVAGLLAQRLPEGELSCFPSWAGPGAPPVAARCAWCYGDPGVAVALLGAARRAGEPRWEHAALEIARRAAAVREQREDVVDAQLCHGAAGVAHAFHRLHRATGDPACDEAARFWFERTLALRRPGEGLAGYRTWTFERSEGGEWLDDPRFLTGIAGTGLALLSAVSDAPPEWDRVLLMSIPDPPARWSGIPTELRPPTSGNCL